MSFKQLLFHLLVGSQKLLPAIRIFSIYYIVFQSLLIIITVPLSLIPFIVSFLWLVIIYIIYDELLIASTIFRLLVWKGLNLRNDWLVLYGFLYMLKSFQGLQIFNIALGIERIECSFFHYLGFHLFFLLRSIFIVLSNVVQLLFFELLSAVHEEFANHSPIHPCLLIKVLIVGVKRLFLNADEQLFDLLGDIGLHVFAEDVVRNGDDILLIRHKLQ